MSDKLKYFIEAWEMNGVGQTIATVQDSPGTVVTITVDDLRAILGRQPAAIDKQEAVAWLYKCGPAVHLEKCQLDHYYSMDRGETYVKGVPLYAAPLGNEASKPAIHRGPCQIDNFSGRVCEFGTRSCVAEHAAPSVEQDERGADMAMAIEQLAKRFWSIHPREIQQMGISRQEFYAREIRTLIASARSATIDRAAANVAQGAQPVANEDCDARIRKWRDAFDAMHRRAMAAEAQSEGLRKDAVRRAALEEARKLCLDREARVEPIIKGDCEWFSGLQEGIKTGARHCASEIEEAIRTLSQKDQQ